MILDSVELLLSWAKSGTARTPTNAQKHSTFIKSLALRSINAFGILTIATKKKVGRTGYRAAGSSAASFQQAAEKLFSQLSQR
jgi:hypothetical protein